MPQALKPYFSHGNYTAVTGIMQLRTYPGKNFFNWIKKFKKKEKEILMNFFSQFLRFFNGVFFSLALTALLVLGIILS